MPRKKKVIPEYGTCIRKGIEYYRTRIVDSDGKRVSLYARTPRSCMKRYKRLNGLLRKHLLEKRIRQSTNTVKNGC